MSRLNTFSRGCRCAMIALGTSLAWGLLAPALVYAQSDPPILERLTIIAPSAPGGGYDLTAQAIKRVLESESIVGAVEVKRSPGAGGLLGLTELVTARAGDGHVLLVGGMVMLGATASNRASISLLDTTPVARLAGEYDVIAVAGDSPYRTLDDLLVAMQAAPGLIRWVGGSAGGADQMLMWQLARAAGVDPHLMHYTALPGGSEIVGQLRSGKFVATVSGLIELKQLMQSGWLRALAISSPQRVAGVEIPTFEELGVSGLSVTNWRGVFAAPGLDAAQKNDLARVIDAMVQTPAWSAELVHHHWKDAHLSGEDFTAFLRAEEQAVRAGEDQSVAAPRLLPSALARRYMWALGPALIAVALLLALQVQRVRSNRREVALKGALNELSQEAERQARSVQEILAGVSSQIEREFDRWGLTAAERAVAHLMLKGLRLKEIAALRCTSGRTVRQQAQAIYRKARLEGRSDLAAYFLEEFLAPMDLRGVGQGPLVGLPTQAARPLVPST